MKIDFRKLGIEKAFANMLKKDFTKDIKQYLRENDDIVGNDYCQVTKDKYSKDTYIKNGEIIKLNEKDIIKQYCEDNDIEIVTETKENYSIELIATPKAQKEAEKMLQKIAENGNKTLAKSANIMLAKSASKR